MLGHLILTVGQILIAFIMLGTLIVLIFAIREAWYSLLAWLKIVVRRRRQYKLDRHQSRLHKEFYDGFDLRSK